MRLRRLRDQLEEAPVQALELGLGLLVGLPEEPKHGIERRCVRLLERLGAKRDALAATPDFFAQHVPTAALQRSEIGLAAALQRDDRPGEADHRKEACILCER